jgi:hypothetical protein
MMKLQQLKAYQPPKLDYLNNIKQDPDVRMKPIKFGGNPEGRQQNNSVNRNDPTRESLQSRLIERIHNKKIQSGNNFSKKKFSNQLNNIQSQGTLLDEKEQDGTTRNKLWQKKHKTKPNDEPVTED